MTTRRTTPGAAAGAANPQPNRRYKDSVFRDIFGTQENKGYALSLYNALAGTSHADPADLELNTLDDVIFMGVRNDVSFLIGDELVLWEHQSTPNPNMPLRGLLYFARLFDDRVTAAGATLHSAARLALPTPRFVVFYNGRAERPAREVMRLSDSFSGARPDVEVTATVVNVNLGRNPELEEACEALQGYAYLVSRTRELYATMGLRDALARAIDECVSRGLLADYLTRRRGEMISRYLTEWDEEAYRANLRQEGFEEGRREGLQEGLQEGLLAALRGYVESTGAPTSEAMEVLKVPEAQRGPLARALEG